MRTKARSLRQAATQGSRVLKPWSRTTQTSSAMAASIWPTLTWSTALPSMLLSTSMTGVHLHMLPLSTAFTSSHHQYVLHAVRLENQEQKQLLPTLAVAPTRTARVPADDAGICICIDTSLC